MSARSEGWGSGEHCKRGSGQTMTKKHGWLLAALVAGQMVLAGGTFAKSPSPVWAHENSDLKPDPGIQFGRLPNGMRYVIFKNATPPGQASIRLRIGSGSLNESDAQQGLAHFLEHMAFKGSKRVPEGEMVKILQRKGLAFGPDTNAFTSFNQTVYKLDLPQTDASTIETAFVLMRETASELTLDAKSMEPERNVVLSEERLRDTPAYRVTKVAFETLLEGQLAPKRFPIGQTEIIKNAPASLVKEFYNANYRPDRATLIVVGDIDPAAIEEKIKATFGDWAPVGPATSEPDLGSIKSRGLTPLLIQQPGDSPLISISWLKPYVDTPDTIARHRKDFVNALGLRVLDRRFDKLARSEHPRFLSARSSYGDSVYSAKVAAVRATSAPESWKEALAAIEQEQRRIVQHGVSQEELNLEITEYRTVLEQSAATAATRTTPDLAAGILTGVDADHVMTSPSENLALFNDIVKGITLGEVNAALPRIFEGAGPLVLVSTPVQIEGGKATVEAEYNKSHAVPVSAPQAEAAVVWPYTDFGKPGTVAEQKDIVDLGIVTARFENGVKLTIKQTNFRQDEILVAVQVGNGRLDLPKDSSVWLTRAFIAAGLKKISLDDIVRILASKVGGASFSISDDGFIFSGRTNKRDLDFQLQLMTADVIDPGYRPEAVERERISYINALPQWAATASGVYSRDSGGLLHSGDPRWTTPTREQFEAGKVEELKGMLQGPLANGAIEVTIVGDVSPEAAIKATAVTFGALPPRSGVTAPESARLINFPAPAKTPVERTHKGRPDESIAFIAWPVTDFYAEPALPYAMYLATEVLHNRLTDQVRSKEGATYSPQAGREMSKAFPGYGYAWSKVETPPSKLDSFYENVSKITADIRANGVTADEFLRARTPTIENIKKQQKLNEYWRTYLTGAQTDPRQFDRIRVALPRYENLTPEDIKRVVAQYLTDDKAWKMVVKPESAQATAANPVVK